MFISQHVGCVGDLTSTKDMVKS